MMRARLSWLFPSLALTACGSRSSLHVEEQAPERTPIECFGDGDCAVEEDKCTIAACQEGKCVVLGTKTCDDGNPCTADSCDPQTGECRYEPLTQDLDGDGHRAPLPGFRPGEPGACGDDCDDTNPNAYPGNAEVCDGIDNDCNGIVDDGLTFVYSADDPIVVSEGKSPAMPAGLTVANGQYLATFTGYESGLYAAYAVPIGATVGNASRLVAPPYQGEAGRPAWAGDRYGVGYSLRQTHGDTHLDTYDIYFRVLTPNGESLGPGVRLERTFSSLNAQPVTVFTGKEFVVVWAHSILDYSVYAQRVDLDGKPIGDFIRVSMRPSGDSPNGETLRRIDNMAPVVAAGRHSLGIAWVRTRFARPEILFRSLDFELNPLMEEPVVLSPTATYGTSPTIAYDQATGNYLVAYHDPLGDPLLDAPLAIYGAVVAEDGSIVTPARPITDSPGQPRYSSLLPLGEQVLLVYSDNKDENGGYELYMKMLDRDLSRIGPEIRLTEAPGDSIVPFATMGRE